MDPTDHQTHEGPAPTLEMTPEQVAVAMARGEVTVVDVRENGEWDAGHIEGALHLPLDDIDSIDTPMSDELVMVCRSGGRSGKATQHLAEQGYVVANMVGGMNAWQESDLPIVDDDGNPGTVA